MNNKLKNNKWWEVNTWKSVMSVIFLYIANEQLEAEIKNNAIYNSSEDEILKYKSNKTCAASIWWKLWSVRKPKTSINGETDCDHGLDDFNITKVTFLTKFIYRYDIIIVQISSGIFVDTEKLTPKYIHKTKRAKIVKTLENEE